MIASRKLVEEDERRREDHYVRLYGATWADYQRLLELRGERSAPRITYLQGTLEIMSPSFPRESIKSTIGCLVEVWCLERGIEFSTCGSWTLQNEESESGAEPDECYVFGPMERPVGPGLQAGPGSQQGRGMSQPGRGRAQPVRPDLAIEVVWTSGGIDKLQVYRKLGVREVWYWRRDRIQVYLLQGERYEPAPGSEALAGIDLEQLASFLDRPTTSAAIKEYRQALQAG